VFAFPSIHGNPFPIIETMKRYAPIIALGLSAAALSSTKADWPTWGGTNARNMVSDGKNPPTEFDPGKKIKGKDEVDLATTKGLKWAARLGSQAYGTLSVANGKILLGTNNENPWDSKYSVKNKETGKVTSEDRSILLCLDEKTGQMVWQLAAPKLGTGKVSDWEYLGMCSGAAADGNRVYIATNRCEVLCLDLDGLKNGNDGFQDEAKYLSSPDNKIEKTGDTDADIIWQFDMREECGVFPHNVTSSNVLVLEDRIYITTSNGVDWTHTNIPAPEAPSLICLDKKTGKLLGEDGAGISKRCLHCSWASPAFASIKGKPMVVFGAGDGFCYGFDMTFKKDEEGFDIINELWRYDANPKEYRLDEKGAKRAYNTYEGPSEIIATPVVYKDRVYTQIGQDPEHGEGKGALSCIDPTGSGDISGKPLWIYKDINRSISTPSIVDDIVYVADYSGLIHAVDANTGEKLSVYDTKGHIWGSTLYIDGKIYVGNEEGELHIIKAGKQMEKIAVIDFPGAIFATPVYANGTLYVMTMSQLYAFGTK
jgi:outer membrane protein assembly factor BamB